MLETELLDSVAFLRTPMVKHEPELTAERLDEESHAACHPQEPVGAEVGDAGVLGAQVVDSGHELVGQAWVGADVTGRPLQ
jgi:hypothetical protein